MLPLRLFAYKQKRGVSFLHTGRVRKSFFRKSMNGFLVNIICIDYSEEREDVMKEFLVKEETKDVMKKLKIPRRNTCAVVLNAELGTTYLPGSALSSYPRLSIPRDEEEMRASVQAENLKKGLKNLYR